MARSDPAEGARSARAMAQSDPGDTPQGGLANPTTFLLLALLVAFFLWSMRRRRAQEERFRELRRQETVTHAEESARDIAHIMRQAAPREAAEAAATGGLASAARVPVQPAATLEPTPQPDLKSDNGVAEIEIAERELLGTRAAAAAEADRAAQSEAADAARRASLMGPSAGRRLDAGEAAAAEAVADTRDGAANDGLLAFEAEPENSPTDPMILEDFTDTKVVALPDAAVVPPPQEVAPAATGDPLESLREGLAALDREVAAPLGAVAGDGSANCPPDYPVKGNQQSMIYHEPGQTSYASTIPEFCFASGEAAEAAGYRHSRARGGPAHE